ncbi:hypothetical protein MASR2M64_01090 [Candidatus Cloacimonadota bacterium]
MVNILGIIKSHDFVPLTNTYSLSKLYLVENFNSGYSDFNSEMVSFLKDPLTNSIRHLYQPIRTSVKK